MSPAWAPGDVFQRTNPKGLASIDSAKIYLLETIRLDSTFLPSYRDLGFVYESKGDNDQCKYTFQFYTVKMDEYLLKNGGKAPVAYYNYLGNVLVVLKKYEQAEAALLKGETLSNGQFPQIYNNLAWVYEITGDYTKSELAIQKAIELLPLNEYGYRIYGNLKYFQQHNPAAEVIPLFKMAAKLGRS
ncbi:MAG: hypothetical protein IPM82_16340 [Saprospiraceae bacterium]|nr:hypothetical protein [Saprospiraceae bacterium]